MGVGTPKHGTLDHQKLEIARFAVRDGEKPRPSYLGRTIALDAAPAADDSKRGPDGDSAPAAH